MGWCDFHEQRGWANDYCLKKGDYVDSTTSKEYCRYDGKGCLKIPVEIAPLFQ